MSKSVDLTTLSGWANLADGDHVVKLKAKGAGFGDSSFSNSVTVTKGAQTVSKNWKFNGSSKNCPALSPSAAWTISGSAYGSSGFIESFNYVYYEDDWSYIAFGSAGFWDTSTNTYGASGGNILKFDTEPSGALLSFLQAHAEPINGGATPKGYKVSYTNAAHSTARCEVKINGSSTWTTITESSGAFDNVETIQFYLGYDPGMYSCRVVSTTLGIDLDSRSAAVTSDVYTVTQDVSDLKISWQPAM